MTTDIRELTEAQIREILAGTAGVTPGPWAYEPHGDTGDYGVGVLVGTEGEQPLRGYQTDSDNIVAETVAVEVNGPLNAAHVARLDPATVAALCNMALDRAAAEAKIAEQAAEIERLRGRPAATAAPLVKCEPAPTSAEEELAAFEPLVDEWIMEINWRSQLDQLAGMSTAFAGKRVSGPAGAECKMLILRQRNLFDRACRQAYLEGIFRGQGLKFTAAGREALARMTEAHAALAEIGSGK